MVNILMVYPKNPRSFWSYDEALMIVGKKSMFPPTGLMTIASMLPKSYDIRLIDENVSALKDSDYVWADAVLVSGMGIHMQSMQKVIKRANALKKPIMAGGPLPTQHHDKLDGYAVFFLGEAESGFLDELELMIKEGFRPERKIVDKRGQFKPLSHTLPQRFDLIKNHINDYMAMAVQITRGCPEHCTFCNIGSLYGKQTRITATDKILQEFDLLYKMGWRSGVMIVDDNVAGNQEALIPILERIIDWQKKHKYPFNFFTQASLRIFDNKQLMESMYQAGFGQVFFGIESPSEDSLKFMGAQKNIQDRGGSGLSIVEKLRIIAQDYFKTQAGFIIGFDKDPDNIDDMIIKFVMDARMSVAMVGPLGILPDTADYQRYASQGRLTKVLYSGDSGRFTRQLSYVPYDNKGNKIDPSVVTNRVKRVIETVNTPENYFARTYEYLKHRKRRALSKMPITPAVVPIVLRSFYHQGIKSNYKKIYWSFLLKVATSRFSDIPDAFNYAVEGHHIIVITREMLKVDDLNTKIEHLLSLEEPHPSDWRYKGEQYLKNFKSGYAALMKKYHNIRVEFRVEVKGIDKLARKYNQLFKNNPNKSTA